MGGAVAQRFAAMYRALQALVLPPPRSSRAPRPPGALLPLRPLLPVSAVSPPTTARRDVPRAAARHGRHQDEYVRPARIRGSMDGLMAMMRDVARDGEVDTRRITMPVLLLYGAHDAIVPLSVAQEIRSRIPHARLVVVERAAHGLLEERPDECEGAIRDFLRETVGARGAVAAASD
jgi:pimeloyl-ACP methyl ester carboxylesterase